jgi:hypothetical protein
MLDLLDTLDYPRIVKLLGSDEEEALALEARRFDEKAAQGFETLLRSECGYTDGQVRRFQDAYQGRVRAFEITEDLCAENFEIVVKLPGELVGANGEAEGSTVTWRFGGKRLRDRDVLLMATSRVGR